MPQRLDAGPAVAATGAALLLVSLFVEWFSPRLSAWNAFEALDVLLAALALAALALALVRLRGAAPADGRLLLALGAVALLAALVQVVDPPPLLADRNLRAGPWLALSASLLLLLGGLLAVARIAVTVTVAPRDPRRRVSAVDRRRAAGAPPSEHGAEPERGGQVAGDGPRTVPFENLAGEREGTPDADPGPGRSR